MQHNIGCGNACCSFADNFHANNFRQPHHTGTPQHNAFCFQTAHANRNHAQSVRMRRVAVRANTTIRKRHTVFHRNHWREFFQVNLVHNAVASWHNIYVFKRRFRPVDKMKTVGIAAFFHRTIFSERIFIKTAKLHRQRMINNQLRFHHRIDFMRITTSGSNGITQTSQIHQSRLPQNIVAHHTIRIPSKIFRILLQRQLF